MIRRVRVWRVSGRHDPFFPACRDTIEAVIAAHLFSLVGDMGAHGGQPFECVKSITDWKIETGKTGNGQYCGTGNGCF